MPSISQSKDVNVMTIPKIRARIDAAADPNGPVQAAFWKAVGQEFPEIMTGDLAPDATFEFEDACLKVIKAWVQGNLELDVHHRNIGVMDSINEHLRPEWKVTHEYPGFLAIHVGKNRTFNVGEDSEGRWTGSLDVDSMPNMGAATRKCLQEETIEAHIPPDRQNDYDYIAGRLVAVLEAWGY